MKIAIMSDLHADNFKDCSRFIPEEGDYLFVAGDLAEIENITERNWFFFHELFSEWSNRFKKVFLVLGNHEFYSGLGTSIWDLIELYQKGILDRFENIQLLNGDDLTLIDDDGTRVNVCGATLWTSFGTFANRHENYKKALYLMNDYRYIHSGDEQKVTPHELFRMFERDLEYIQDFIERQSPGEKTIIMTHHSPSLRGQHPDPLVEAVFAKTNVFFKSEIIPFLRFSTPTIWIHGHSHFPLDFMENGCRILCNPHGYIGEDCSKGFAPKIVEV